MAYEAGVTGTTDATSQRTDYGPGDMGGAQQRNGTRTTAKVNVLALVVALALPVGVGLLSSALTGDAMSQFGRLNQPPLSPPAELFPIAWTILYVLMGGASYLIYSYRGSQRDVRGVALTIYGIQLAFNFAWSLLFFGGDMYYLAFGWLIAMWGMIIALIALARKIRPAAAWLLVPYLAWTTFAAYLNLGVAILN